MDDLALLRPLLRRWMQSVMDENGWTAQEWAQRAGTTATNITRFLKGCDHIPSYCTLVKLALAAGVSVPTPRIHNNKKKVNQ